MSDGAPKTPASRFTAGCRKAPAKDPALYSPLARFWGARPPTPAWFDKALENRPQETFINVRGAQIETFAWGDIGKPGLLFMHGNGAHAGWWRFIAPFFASDYRVAAFSWSGMGRSDWRAKYEIDTFVDEALAVAEHTGLFAGPAKPLVVAHSFGSAPMAGLVAAHGARFGGAIVVDSPFITPERRAERRKQRGWKPRPPQEYRPNRVYPTLNAALARFRLAPLQPCENLFIADLIAREGLKQAPLENGEGLGWTWAFDPFMWRDFTTPDMTARLAAAQCPTALIYGARSNLMNAEDARLTASLMAPGAPVIAIPDADHHVMIDQPLALVAALQSLFASWPK
jgi:pimeloyl-ACP methyl ester carboxylesterase